MIIFGYVRVSTKDQNLERQYTSIKSFRPDIPDSNIFCDKQTGKNFDRDEYQKMKVIMEHVVRAKSDGEIVEFVIEELDRLGRDSGGIKKELEWFRELGVVVRILEIPTTLLDVNRENAWITELVTSILIEVYAAMAQAELEKRAKRQAEGIAEAQKKGVKFGRPSIKIDEQEFQKIYKIWKDGKITAVAAMNELGLKPNSFYRKVKQYEGSWEHGNK